MKLCAYYTPKMQYRAWLVRPAYIRWADSWRPAWVGVWFRLGWRYLNIGLNFKEAGRG